MKKTLLITFITLSLCFAGITQNLVPNPSFEEYTSCPDDQCQIYKATDWLSMGFSPDYFNACDPSLNNFGVPSNIAGFQYAASGVAYAGIGCYVPGNNIMREYIGIRLLDSLTIGVKYKVEFKASPANKMKYAINKLGVLFATKSYEIPDYINYCIQPNDTTIFPQNNSQVYTNNIIGDTAFWTEVSGSIIADSSYEYIVIGNFFINSLIDDSIINPLSYNIAACYYIDDVYVGIDTTDAISEMYLNEKKVNIYPNPSSGIIYFSINDNYNSCEILIYNIIGKLIYQNTFNISENKLNLEGVNSGLYFIKFYFNNKSVTKKLTIVKQ